MLSIKISSHKLGLVTILVCRRNLVKSHTFAGLLLLHLHQRREIFDANVYVNLLLDVHLELLQPVLPRLRHDVESLLDVHLELLEIVEDFRGTV